ncbi:MAG: hypothetical protein U1F43_15515 [Myxococcota bacterium]
MNYLSIIHKALKQVDAEHAIRGRRRRARGPARPFLCHRRRLEPALTTLECSARDAWRADLASGINVHANHCLRPETQALEGSVPTSSSRARQTRMTDLGRDTHGELGMADLQRFFADTANGADAIARDDVDGLNTNGAVIMAPEAGTILVCHGVPSRGTWIDLKAATA